MNQRSHFHSHLDMDSPVAEDGVRRGRRRGRGRGSGRGEDSGGGDEFGRGRGRGRGPGRGARARRGDIRASVLALLAERPMHGYEIIGEIAQRTEDVWRPSAGSVYPTLQLLEEEGAIVGSETDGKRRFELTEIGTTELAAQSDKAPWERVLHGAGRGHGAMRESMGSLTMAVKQVATTGTDDQRVRAVALLDETRRAMYAILAEA